MASTYFAYNGPMVTTAGYVQLTTGTVIKTQMQVLAPAANPITVWKWGLDFDGVAASPGIKCELIDTFAIAATVTAHVAAGVMPFGPDQTPSRVQLGVAATGYNATAEGAITQTRYGSVNTVYAGNGDRNEWSLGREFFVPAGHVVRIRTTTAVAVNCLAYMCWEE